MVENFESYAYEFDVFRVEPQNRLLLKAGEPVEIGERAFDVLLLLIQNAGKVVERESVFREVWGDIALESNNLDQCLYTLRNTFGDNSNPRRFIRSIPRRGLVFLPKVSAISLSPHPQTTLRKPIEASEHTSDPYPIVKALARSSRIHLLVSCALYGSLFSVAFLLESAYEFDRFGTTSIELAVGGFLLVFVTSWLGLQTVRTRTLRGGPGGLTVVILIFIIVGLVISFVFGSGLPDAVITKAKFETLPAQAAYLKNVVYFLPLGIIYMVLPFHFVSVAEREIRIGRGREIGKLLKGRASVISPMNAFHVRPFWLVVLLILALIGSQFAESHLFENLKPSSHLSLFVKLVQVRRLLYFALGVECLLWYQNALNKLKQMCS